MEIMWEDDDVAGSSSGSNNSRVVNEIYGWSWVKHLLAAMKFIPSSMLSAIMLL